ncbi:MAG: bifunctional adenosylcobinamide kinase/adenosylcobinamide-phosphate guanylyltransferase [Mesorhizobium sp.]|uniref:bifunctional adenosylcobinamide kinase/adenosylcobinamide-phosphate guanylyltransferase n=1 Tax=Mesorhizobium sp. TaxID=1871066 RepID=UPI000FE9A28D|nr:bifunctional adenosylcobinamide kinase/adenosylcobinamide-phosphate guanylyltransferase [Mesorhizobium sp.]RWM01985.1 MAG: bifunctional adenosylcobinamide kinase/adenosylcobinamide-phosphate guanylyltransferase [Mesorhizobium sp.]TIO47627.1 MAG: bifunctional adenosylcobinamide kinase/adenosylcobinamide-phosphate guanylyltransferase [Mesorhizobium sp.]TIO55812.1 MAG: bifunctional adenosylcobinamide kinase/adenosylcobinamide-phosphate guanylyltransferase [Mesorhizobium sp.]TJV57075.1 MAG: bifu
MPDRATSRLTFILGGARSGKSAHAETLATASPSPWVYIATAQAYDDEMRERIALHRSRRGEGWVTVDAPLDLTGAIEASPDHQPVLIDCLTLWLTNHMLAEHDLEAECRRLADVLSRPRGPWFVVSNEVGLGIVPDNALARRFRDAAGRLNQQVAAVADSVLMMVAGLPLKVK